MKKISIIIAVVVAVICIGAIVYFLIRPHSPAQNQPSTQTNPSGELPQGGMVSPSTGANTQQGGSEQRLQLTTGEIVTVPDFTAGHPSYTEPSGTYYQVTETLDYQDTFPNFSITIGTDSTVAIGLTQEPLKQARLDAEAELRTLLPLTDAQLCELHVTVMASPSANEIYAGENLGFSFCPGATPLP